MTEMRILTVAQPWAWALVHGGKDVENRTRNIAGDYRGPVAIHAALRRDDAHPAAPAAHPGQSAMSGTSASTTRVSSPAPFRGGLGLRRLDPATIAQIQEQLA